MSQKEEEEVQSSHAREAVSCSTVNKLGSDATASYIASVHLIMCIINRRRRAKERAKNTTSLTDDLQSDNSRKCHKKKKKKNSRVMRETVSINIEPAFKCIYMYNSHLNIFNTFKRI